MIDRESTPHERVLANQGLVGEAANSFRRRSTPYEDLLQYGNLGLVDAVRYYDPDRGVKFSTFAMKCIRRAMAFGLDGSERFVGLTLGARRMLREYRQAAESLKSRIGREPSEGEVLDSMGLRRARRANFAQVLRAERIGRDDWDAAIGAGFVEDSRPPGADAEDVEALRHALAGIDDLSRRVIEIHYGLGGREPVSRAEAARELGISPAWAMILEHRALDRMRSIIDPDSAAGRKSA